MQANAVAEKQKAAVVAKEKADAAAREAALQGSNAAADTAPGIKAGREYDILKSGDLRAGPGEDQPRKVNQKASDLLGEIHYLSVDSSVTVRVHQTKDGWADVHVTQPSYLTASHRGWIPIDCIQGGANSNKVGGWIRHRCLVYAGKSTNSATVGYLSPPSSVGVADDNSGWLRLIHGPIKIEGTDIFVDNPNFEGGLYIEASKFTTVVPGKWNK